MSICGETDGPKRFLPALVIVVSVCFLAAFFTIKYFPAGASIASLGVHSYLTGERTQQPGRRIGFLMFVLSLLLTLTGSRVPGIHKMLVADSVPLRVCAFVFLSSLIVLHFLSNRQIEFADILAAAIVLALFANPKMFSHRITKLCFIMCVLFFLLLPIKIWLSGPPNFWFADKFPDAVNDIEVHSAIILTGPADRLANGLRLFSQVDSRYGVIFTTLLALYQKIFGSLEWGQIIRAIGLFQIIFLFGSSFLYWRHTRGFNLGSLIAILLVIPAFPIIGYNVQYPHASSLRFFGFLIAGFFLLFLGKVLIIFRSLIAGCTSGLCILINPESGFCITAGLGILVFSRTSWRNPYATLKECSKFVAGFIVSFLVFDLFLYLSFGYSISLSTCLETFRERFRLASLGLTNHGKLSLNVFPTLIICHCAYVVVALTYKGIHKLNKRDLSRLCIAVINILWMSYYFNTPIMLFLSGNIFLYGFLVADLLLAFSSSKFFRGQNWSRAVLVPLVFVIFQISFVGIHNYSLRLSQTKMFARSTGDTVMVSGIAFSKRIAGEINMRSRYVRQKAQKGMVYYFTLNSVLIPKVSGFYPDIPANEIFFSPGKPAQTRQIVQGVIDKNPPEILVDAPDLLLRGEFTKLMCIENVRQELSAGGYGVFETKDGWQVWKSKNKRQ